MNEAASKTAATQWISMQRRALIAAVIGCVVLALGFVISPDHFFRAYLVAYNFWLGIALGCLVLLMLQHLTGGAWGILLRRIFEAGTRTLPLMVVLYAPLVVGLPRLYVWARPNAVAHDVELAHKSPYLNVPSFFARAAIYFMCWVLAGFLLNRWSARQDRARNNSVDSSRKFRILSGAGLVLYGLTITFASIDWIMSLEPLWYSTIFPPLYAGGQVLEGMAFAIVALAVLANGGPLAGVVEPVRLRDFGNLLLTFVMMWAYLSFSQFLLIWAENMPEETPWYLNRIRGGWQWIALGLIVLEFAIPFLLLLSRDVKEHPRRLAAVALLVLGMSFIDLFWWVEAAFPGSMWFYWLLDVAALVGLGGIWIWWFVGQLKRRPLLPLRDPYFAEYLPEHSPEEAAYG